MNKILVTGGAGFVGSHTCKSLAAAGFLPVTYDDLSNGVRDAVKWGPFEQGRLEDEARVAAVMRAHRPIAVIHFAAFIEAGQSVREPARFYRNNIGGSLALLQVMQAHGLDKIIFSSTAAVYGNPQFTPIPEHHPLAPVNPYGRGKLMTESILADLDAAHGMRHVVLRYFNACGADPDGELRENHQPETHLIPLALQAAYGQRADIAVFGTDYPTPDGTCVRDYVHVTDLASAHVLALKRLLADGASLTANLGTGRGYSVREVIAAVAAVTARDVPIRLAERRPGDPAILVADATVARRELGWSPQFPELTQQVQHAAVSFGYLGTGGS
ncbi:UDP-L-arabinose 4-epimerase [Nitrospirillum amazonense]|uniref:UDP-glucose 4-epimerase n=1 Tax=Nitrospirillum amazonense TaxID=28077 RepID=A0A560FSF0_9PROT|nr:UDP-glucose 4-epimerase GalE [Nitrospirillum amazonense]TWB24568.1 UDP-L-arabinose 4-epimerase [Nitrospirillum amazonense]